MKTSHIDAFHAWWSKTHFGSALPHEGAAWHRPAPGDTQQRLPSPVKVAAAAWNAAWHLMRKEAAEANRAIAAEAIARRATTAELLFKAMAEIDELEAALRSAEERNKTLANEVASLKLALSTVGPRGDI